MAVTWAITNLKRNVEGAKRAHRGTATATPTATYSTGGDSITAAALGLHTIEAFNPSATQNATPLAFQPRAVVAANGQSVAIRLFGTNAAPGAAVPDPQVTAATNVDNYAFDFEAIGT